MKPVDILYDIADAIRERASLPKTTLMPVRGTNGFAQRINAIVAATGTNPDARRIFHFKDFLTPAELQSRNLWLLDGRPLYSSVNAGMYNLFRVANSWQPGYMLFSPNRVYDTFRLVGTKLYVGSSTALNHILVVNTTNGAVTEIPMPASRAYSRFDLVGTWIYCLHPSTSVNSIFCINTANDSVHTITLPATRGYLGAAKIGNRWFMASRGSNTQDLVYLDVTSHPATAHTLANVTSTSRTQHLIPAGNKLLISSASATDYVAVIDGSVPSVLGEIPGLPNRIHDASYYDRARWLYLSSSSTTAITEIVRIDMSTNSLWGTCTVPSRKYSTNLATNTNAFTGKLIGTKLYVGSETSADTLVVINNSTGAVGQIAGLPSRTWPLVDDDPLSFPNWDANYVFESTGATWHQRTHLVGAKLYLSTTSGNFDTLVFITTNATWAPTDSVTQISGLASRAYNRFYVNGTTLYCLASTNATTIELINTSNDTRLTAISGLTSRAYGVPIKIGTDRLYFGSTASATNIPIINLTTNALDTNLTNLPSATYTHLYLLTGKIYCGRTASQTGLLVLGDSVLPNGRYWNGSALVTGPVYIRPD